MDHQAIALFGEAERGDFQKPYLFHSLPELIDRLGHPPPESHGLFFAIQSLLYDRKIIYMRVEEEGFSFSDYYQGLYMLECNDLLEDIQAFCAPGMGDREVVDEIFKLCCKNRSILITTEKDLYDYLTD